jgi:hypothetical protein
LALLFHEPRLDAASRDLLLDLVFRVEVASARCEPRAIEFVETATARRQSAQGSCSRNPEGRRGKGREVASWLRTRRPRETPLELGLVSCLRARPGHPRRRSAPTLTPTWKATSLRLRWPRRPFLSRLELSDSSVLERLEFDTLRRVQLAWHPLSASERFGSVCFRLSLSLPHTVVSRAIETAPESLFHGSRGRRARTKG